MRNTISCILFSIFIIVLFLAIEKNIRNKMYAYNIGQFYNEPKNIDIFFIGSSRIYYPMSPMYIWNKYGVTSYNRGSSGQYYKLTYLFMKEIITLYNPKLIVIDILYLQTLQTGEPNRNISISNMQNNLYKLSVYQYIYNDYKNIYEHINTYNKFHTRWKELNQYDFKTDSFWKGQYTGTFIKNYWDKLHLIRKQEKQLITISDNISLKKDTIEYCNKIIKLAKKHNINIIFVKNPVPVGLEEYKLDMAFQKAADSNDWKFINYNQMYDTINLDFNTDFRDPGHLNLYGSRKVMDHLIPYIIEKYNIPNRKNDPEFASWNEDYKKYERAINREEIREIKDFDKWFNLAMYQDYIITIASRNGLPKNIDKNLFNYLDRLGLSKIKEYKPKDNYIAIIDDKKVFDEQIGKDNLSFKGRMKRIVNLNIFSSINKADIFISGTNRSKNRNGLNFVIYDKINKEIIDSIWIDPANISTVSR